MLKRVYILIFLADAIAMTIEMVAARMLSPYFGSSQLVWTAIIGTILLASSLGNYFGGKIADRKNKDNFLWMTLFCTQIWILIAIVSSETIPGLLSLLITSQEIGALLSAIFMFFFPSVMLGVLTPTLLALSVSNKDYIATYSGKFYATMTFGGLTGTFISGFYLIPTFGSIQILFVIVALIGVMQSFLQKSKLISIFFLSWAILLAIGGIYIANDINDMNIEKVRNASKDCFVSVDTRSGHVRIWNGKDANGDDVRVLNVSGGFESGTYLNESKRHELAFPYTRLYTDAVENGKRAGDNTLMIGGGGYSFPKFFISHYPGMTIDVVEIDGKITEIARDFFFLKELEQEYNTRENKRLNICEEDGRVFLNRCITKYAVIMNDAFSGDTPVRQLASLEAVKQIKDCLIDGGVYATNIVGNLKGLKRKFIVTELATIATVFPFVYMVKADESKKNETIHNYMIYASTAPLKLSRETISIDSLATDKVFTDEWMPVEYLK